MVVVQNPPDHRRGHAIAPATSEESTSASSTDVPLVGVSESCAVESRGARDFQFGVTLARESRHFLAPLTRDGVLKDLKRR